MSDPLDLALRDLGRHVRTAGPSADLADLVLERVRVLPVPAPSLLARLRSRAGRLVALLAALLVGTGVVVSPVGAHVAEWFGFSGVAVRVDDPDLTGDPRVPIEPSLLTLDEAAELAGFTPAVPTVLGRPDGISVSTDGRVVSMSWGSGAEAVRLDQFRATLAPDFWKTAPDAELTSVGGEDALWFPTAHDVAVVSPEGDLETHAPRLAAPTLIWIEGELTLRLEGDHTLAEAVAVAESAD